MKKVLITGSQPHLSRVVFETLSTVYDVSELSIGPQPISSSERGRIKKRDVDIIVYIGDLARSSWDDDNRFQTEANTLATIAEIAEERQIRVVMISSDRVFAAPTLFHDDQCECYSVRKSGQQTLKHEKVIRSLQDSLVIRTNIVDGSRAEDALCNRVLASLERNQQLAVDASVFATPISLDSFCQGLLKVMQQNVCGVINIGGAERTTPFHLAMQLARQCGFDSQLLQPKPGAGSEQSLRCSALRTLGVTAPLLRETVEMLNVGQESSELIAA